MQRHLRVVDEPLEEFVEQVDVEIADARARKLDVIFEPRASGEVDHHARERLVERNVRVAVATDTALVADRLRDRLAERDPDVFDRVMRIYVQVAVRADREIDEPVARDLIEHGPEERKSGVELRRPPAVQVDADRDPGLFGFARYGGGTFGHGNERQGCRKDSST